MPSGKYSDPIVNPVVTDITAFDKIRIARSTDGVTFGDAAILLRNVQGAHYGGILTAPTSDLAVLHGVPTKVATFATGGVMETLGTKVVPEFANSRIVAATGTYMANAMMSVGYSAVEGDFVTPDNALVAFFIAVNGVAATVSVNAEFAGGSSVVAFNAGEFVHYIGINEPIKVTAANSTVELYAVMSVDAGAGGGTIWFRGATTLFLREMPS